MNIHWQTQVEGGLDLKCKSCDFVGSAMKDLRIHVILLHKNKGIKCPHCDYFTYPKVANKKYVVNSMDIYSMDIS